jgi:hypothetical protein
MKIKAARNLQTLVSNHHNTRPNNLENHESYFHRRENLKPHLEVNIKGNPHISHCTDNIMCLVLFKLQTGIKIDLTTLTGKAV